MPAAKWRRKEFTKSLAKSEVEHEEARLFAASFNLKEFLVKSTGQEIAAYYRRRDQNNFHAELVPPDRQEPILAARADARAAGPRTTIWRNGMKAKPCGKSSGPVRPSTGDIQIARKAVVEGKPWWSIWITC